MQPSYMGQDLMNPPSVEGWHTGSEWINSGSLMSRINFVAEQLGDASRPGVRAIIDRLRAQGTLQPAQLVDGCLDLLGPVQVGSETRNELLAQAESWGPLDWSNEQSPRHVTEMLQLIAATREYQFA
jgi:hypothetical protein